MPKGGRETIVNVTEAAIVNVTELCSLCRGKDTHISDTRLG